MYMLPSAKIQIVVTCVYRIVQLLCWLFQMTVSFILCALNEVGFHYVFCWFFFFAYQFSIEFLLTRLAIGCRSFVSLLLHLHVFQWKPPCTALVFTALTRLLRLLRLFCAWIHLPASEKIGAQVSLFFFSSDWDQLPINNQATIFLLLSPFRRVYPSRRSNPGLPAHRHAFWHDLWDRGGNINWRLLRGWRRGHERPHGRTRVGLRASQEEKRSVVGSETRFSRPPLKTRTFKFEKPFLTYHCGFVVDFKRTCCTLVRVECFKWKHLKVASNLSSLSRPQTSNQIQKLDS